MREILSRAAAAVVVCTCFLASISGGCVPQVLMTPRERGDSMTRNGHYGAAGYWYDRAIREDPNDWLAYAGRARARSQNVNLDHWPADRPKADLAGALADYDRAVELQQDTAQLYANRGTVRAVVGQSDGALADIDRAMQLDPKDPTLQGYRGLVLLRMGRDAEAKAALDTCAKKYPAARGELSVMAKRIKAKRTVNAAAA